MEQDRTKRNRIQNLSLKFKELLPCDMSYIVGLTKRDEHFLNIQYHDKGLGN